MERFDPIHSMHFEREITAAKRSWAEILTNPKEENPIWEQLYQFLIEEFAPEGDVEEQRGKIITKWRFYRHLEIPITPEIMRKLDKTEKIHKIRFNYMYQLRNIENDETMAYFKESERSPWLNRLSETEDWIAEKKNVFKVHTLRPRTRNGFLRTI